MNFVSIRSVAAVYDRRSMSVMFSFSPAVIDRRYRLHLKNLNGNRS